MAESDNPSTMHQLGQTRLAIGLVQGLLLYALYRADDTHSWPATDPFIFAPAALVLLYVPLLAIQGAGSMRMRTLGLWSLAALAILAALAWYDRWRVVLPVLDGHSQPARRHQTELPSFSLFVFSAAGLFMAQALIAAKDETRKWVAPYTAYFDAAWKQGLQLALAAVFVGVFWGVLQLGAALFDLIGLKFLSRLIGHAWFAIPATTAAIAAALHLTDIRARLIAGTRSVVLVLLSWLLPLLTVLAVGFLVSLLVTGLEPLWKTGSAAALLLVAAAVLVVLINAAWQDGPEHHTAPFLLRLGGSAAALTLTPLVALAAYALALRVGQHGWSENRIHATAVIVVAGGYALGYGWAALEGTVLRGHWLRRIGAVNIVVSVLILGVLLVLFSPIADPMRIAVASQLARLESGAVPAAKFDYAYLRWHGGRFGHDALTRLATRAHGRDARAIREAAKSALAAESRSAGRRVSKEQLAAKLTVYPQSYRLPESLLAQDWTKEKSRFVPPCLKGLRTPCQVFPAELTGHPPDQFILIWGSKSFWNSAVLDVDAKGHWSVVGRLAGAHCKGIRQALRKGHYEIVPPAPPRYRAIDTGAGRLTVEETASRADCPK